MKERIRGFLLIAVLVFVALGLTCCSPKADDGDGVATPSPATPRAPSSPVEGVDLPEDYPHELGPIYEPSTIIDVQTIGIIDGETYIIIELVSKDEMTEIKSFYEGLDHFTNSFDRGDGSYEMFLECDEGDEVFLTVGDGGEDAAPYRDKGYKTHVLIRVVLHP